MGLGYDGKVSIENQVCTTVGSQPGQTIVDGNNYVALDYNYQYGHLWRVYIIFSAITVFN
jgi:ATP-binding cassette, subfamily G (WHITE), member 2, SNQ2